MIDDALNVVNYSITFWVRSRKSFYDLILIISSIIQESAEADAGRIRKL
jgi:hypothetical protein